MQKHILHILAPDKFTIPFIYFINKEFKSDDHFFLCNSDPGHEVLEANKNVAFIYSPYRKNIFRNARIFYNCIRNCSKVILHGNPILFYFLLFPSVLKKTYWFIYGYELESQDGSNNKSLGNLIRAIEKKYILKRIYGHISHIRGDSERANILFNSKAKFFYSQGYLSNVVKEPGKQLQANYSQKNKKILVGNSTSPSNNHISVFKMLLPYKDDDILVYCPLSYGIYEEYKIDVINTGKTLFGNKFISLTEFMTLEAYNCFLEEMDIAVFNHNRQEGMGITLSLLSMGKTVYMNPETTSFRSMVERGFKVFDNALIEIEGLYKNRDVSLNPELVYKYYSYQTLIDSLTIVFNH